jgi:hypothetical protein
MNNDVSKRQQSLDNLRREHALLESRLKELERPRSISPEESYEMQVIKKRKLSIKDRISVLEAR